MGIMIAARSGSRVHSSLTASGLRKWGIPASASFTRLTRTAMIDVSVCHNHGLRRRSSTTMVTPRLSASSGVLESDRQALLPDIGTILCSVIRVDYLVTG